MKKLIALGLVLVCVLGLVGCGQQGHQNPTNPTQNNKESISTDNQTESEQNTEPEIEKTYISIADFSYTEDKAIYTEGKPGVKTSGFVNTTETEITFENVAEHAMNECTIEYNSAIIYLDTAECVWKVNFFNYGTVGGDQTVYMDYDGKTVLIVYGE